ncbi:hypothetical protein F4819DRAFT_507836 [Hypoxylon fuscum]|nr:hypothetical protein F4819DRAFT_507836 [Hypoxylon fuscum]
MDEFRDPRGDPPPYTRYPDDPPPRYTSEATSAPAAGGVANNSVMTGNVLRAPLRFLSQAIQWTTAVPTTTSALPPGYLVFIRVRQPSDPQVYYNLVLPHNEGLQRARYGFSSTHSVNLQGPLIIYGYVHTEKHLHLSGDFEVTKSTSVAGNVNVTGSLRCYRDLKIRGNLTIHGSCVVSLDVTVLGSVLIYGQL